MQQETLNASLLLPAVSHFLDFPLTYIAFEMGLSPTSGYIIHFFVYSILQITKVFFG